jgi:hypothetical protein
MGQKALILQLFAISGARNFAQECAAHPDNYPQIPFTSVSYPLTVAVVAGIASLETPYKS